LSSVASTLAALEPELRAPEFDQAKVEAIKQAMREGKFEVNANAIADKLITSVQELLSRKNAN
jgi:negative regulator of flagellin synthesis FlgM